MLDLALYAEEPGFHGAHLDDHVQRLFDEQTMPFLEAMTTLPAFGVHTKKIRLGHITIFNSLRNLAYLAKTITTLDNMFKSRYGILPGKGWMKPEYEGYDLTGVLLGWKRTDHPI